MEVHCLLGSIRCADEIENYDFFLLHVDPSLFLKVCFSRILLNLSISWKYVSFSNFNVGIPHWLWLSSFDILRWGNNSCGEWDDEMVMRKWTLWDAELSSIMARSGSAVAVYIFILHTHFCRAVIIPWASSYHIRWLPAYWNPQHEIVFSPQDHATFR